MSQLNYRYQKGNGIASVKNENLVRFHTLLQGTVGL